MKVRITFEVFPSEARAIAAQTGDEPSYETVRDWIKKAVQATLDDVVAEFEDQKGRC